MWARVPTYSFQALISLSMFVLCAQSRQYSLKIRKSGRPLKGSFHCEKNTSMTECVRSCVRHSDCRSIGYNKTSGACHLYSANMADTENRSGEVLGGILREVVLDNTRQLPTRPIVLKRGRMKWRDAERACYNIDAVLFTIYNETKQATAVNMATDSGLEYIAIGVFWNKGKWVDIQHNKLVYTNWAKGEPASLHFYGALSKKTGYKWAAISGEVDGRLCQ